MWFVELSGRMDGRQPDGNRVAKITLDGKVTEYPIPSATGSPINIAVGPDRNIWFTKAHGKLGRVTRDGVITSSSTCRHGRALDPPDSPPAAFAARPIACIDTLWFTESAGNRLAYLSFAN